LLLADQKHAVRTRPIIPPLLIALTLLLAPTGTAAASAWSPTVGVADNNSPMFADPNHIALRAPVSRKIVPYDYLRDAGERADLERWIRAARNAGVRPLIAFNHSERNPARLPSVGAFSRSLRRLIALDPGLRDFSPWNEANHRSQPTYRNPRRAAQYFNAARRICRGCRIVAADVLDQQNMLPWLAQFRRTARRPAIWGLHNYVDVNRAVPWRSSSLRRLLGAVPGTVWLTETGGIVAFSDVYSYDERRAASATRRTLVQAARSRRVKRVYLYDWYGVPQPHRRPYLWDSGLVSAASRPRPALAVVRRWMATHPAARNVR
jgi:hypothetical protein